MNEKPLGAYATIMTIFLAAFRAVAASLRRNPATFSQTPPTRDIALLGIVTLRVTASLDPIHGKLVGNGRLDQPPDGRRPRHPPRLATGTTMRRHRPLKTTTRRVCGGRKVPNSRGRHRNVAPTRRLTG